MSRRADKTGRSKGGGKFVALPEFMLASVAWSTCSPVARAMLVEVLRIFNGGNNGRLAMSARDAAQRLGSSKDTAARALRELQQKGLIEPVAAGYFSSRAPKATEWRVTWQRCDVTKSTASKAFLKWTPEKLERRTIPGTVRYENRDSKPERGAAQSDMEDSNGHFERVAGTIMGTHLDIYHTTGASAVSAGQRAQAARPEANVIPLNVVSSEADESFSSIGNAATACLSRLPAIGRA